jgi:hypothetical protein
MGAVRSSLGCAIWIVVGIIPVFQSFYIGPDLQGARYIYLSSIGWAALLVIISVDDRGDRSWTRVYAQGAVLAWLMIAAYGTRQHLVPWIQAAKLRDLVEQRAADNPEMRQCGTLRLANLPDNVRGAYVFRVGIGEDFQRQFGLRVVAGIERGPCSFRWDDQTLSFAAFHE